MGKKRVAEKQPNQLFIENIDKLLAGLVYSLILHILVEQ